MDYSSIIICVLLIIIIILIYLRIDIYNHNTCKYTNYQHIQNNNHLYNIIDNTRCDKSSTIQNVYINFILDER